MHCKVFLVFALAGALHGQGVINPDFEQDTTGEGPAGWRVTSGTALWKSEGCRQGKGCVEVSSATSGTPQPGILLQSIDATPYRGKLLRYRAAVRVSDRGRAGLWLRVDRANRQFGFFDNMSNRPIVQPDWQHFEINGFVHRDAERIFLRPTGKFGHDHAR